jgi:hypothetical protein
LSLGFSSPLVGTSGAATWEMASTARLINPFPAFFAAVDVRRTDLIAARTLFLAEAILRLCFLTTFFVLTFFFEGFLVLDFRAVFLLCGP